MNYYSRRRALKMIGLDDFLHVSRLLTQQDDLSPALAHALMLALTQTHTAFARDLTTLIALLQNQPGLLLQDRLTFASEDAASEALAKAILGGWYTGVVGKGKAALYVTYVNTLSSQLVRDKVVPPGFAYGPVGSWAKQP